MSLLIGLGNAKRLQTALLSQVLNLSAVPLERSEDAGERSGGKAAPKPFILWFADAQTRSIIGHQPSRLHRRALERVVGQVQMTIQIQVVGEGS